MKPYILIFFLLGLGLLNSCTKEEKLPEPEEGKPVIYLDGQIDSFPFKLESGINATFGSTATYRYINQNKDTLMVFSFSMSLVDDRKRVLQTIDVFLNNHSVKTTTFEKDFDSTIKPGEYGYAYTDVSSYPNAPYIPSQAYISFTDYVSGYSYSSLTHWQGMNKFKILSVRDEYRDGKRYKVAEVSFNIHMRCMSHLPQYYIPFSAKGFIAFGPA